MNKNEQKLVFAILCKLSSFIVKKFSFKAM